MKFEWNKRYTTIALYAAGLLVFAFACGFLLLKWNIFGTFINTALNVSKPLIYAIGIAYLLWPMLRFFETRVFGGLEKKKPRKKAVRTLSLISVYIVFLSILSLFIGIIIPQIMTSFQMLMDRMSNYISTAQTWIDDFIIGNTFIDAAFINEQLDKLNDLINQLISWIYDNFKNVMSGLTSYAANFATELKNILLGIVFAVYFLLFKEHLLAQVR
ncbi:MAG: AI-2E family transporter, partial [Clostridia bacterium]|nr:AI-2E family transporter [Clostridia bacterium]